MPTHRRRTPAPLLTQRVSEWTGRPTPLPQLLADMPPTPVLGLNPRTRAYLEARALAPHGDADAAARAHDLDPHDARALETRVLLLLALQHHQRVHVLTRSLSPAERRALTALRHELQQLGHHAGAPITHVWLAQIQRDTGVAAPAEIFGSWLDSARATLPLRPRERDALTLALGDAPTTGLHPGHFDGTDRGTLSPRGHATLDALTLAITAQWDQHHGVAAERARLSTLLAAAQRTDTDDTRDRLGVLRHVAGLEREWTAAAETATDWTRTTWSRLARDARQARRRLEHEWTLSTARSPRGAAAPSAATRNLHSQRRLQRTTITAATARLQRTVASLRRAGLDVSVPEAVSAAQERWIRTRRYLRPEPDHVGDPATRHARLKALQAARAAHVLREITRALQNADALGATLTRERARAVATQRMHLHARHVRGLRRRLALRGIAAPRDTELRAATTRWIHTHAPHRHRSGPLRPARSTAIAGAVTQRVDALEDYIVACEIALRGPRHWTPRLRRWRPVRIPLTPLARLDTGPEDIGAERARRGIAQADLPQPAAAQAKTPSPRPTPPRPRWTDLNTRIAVWTGTADPTGALAALPVSTDLGLNDATRAYVAARLRDPNTTIQDAARRAHLDADHARLLETRLLNVLSRASGHTTTRHLPNAERVLLDHLQRTDPWATEPRPLQSVLHELAVAIQSRTGIAPDHAELRTWLAGSSDDAAQVLARLTAPAPPGTLHPDHLSADNTGAVTPAARRALYDLITRAADLWQEFPDDRSAITTFDTLRRREHRASTDPDVARETIGRLRDFEAELGARPWTTDTERAWAIRLGQQAAALRRSIQLALTHARTASPPPTVATIIPALPAALPPTRHATGDAYTVDLTNHPQTYRDAYVTAAQRHRMVQAVTAADGAAQLTLTIPTRAPFVLYGLHQQALGAL